MKKNSTAKPKKRNSKNQPKLTAIGPMDFFVKRSGTTNSTTDSSTSAATSSSNIGTSSRTRQANVCGETELNTVSDIIREWIETEVELNDEDVAYILKYFYDLIEERNLTYLAAVVQTFHELVGNRGDYEWKEAYNNVIMSIQYELSSDQALQQNLLLPKFDI
ncbi:DNA repair protein REV1 isoform X2 [Tetranychus urticae]|uniref:DNA repair protein REV1 isoform X2 n=1 Tax=Tetranychus urticae TaxID=32264 RepID=UPI000D65B2E6|nr:DNA repair protein REV1 isoform X2 [Tetranychus urticae]XP_025017896.1 DNA repair protein REV1 isoform X2 [Tetranychus urticae]